MVSGWQQTRQVISNNSCTKKLHPHILLGQWVLPKVQSTNNKKICNGYQNQSSCQRVLIAKHGEILCIAQNRYNNSHQLLFTPVSFPVMSDDWLFFGGFSNEYICKFTVLLLVLIGSVPSTASTVPILGKCYSQELCIPWWFHAWSLQMFKPGTLRIT